MEKKTIIYVTVIDKNTYNVNFVAFFEDEINALAKKMYNGSILDAIAHRLAEDYNLDNIIFAYNTEDFDFSLL